MNTNDTWFAVPCCLKRQFHSSILSYFAWNVFLSHLGRVALLDDPGNERELEYVFCWGALVDGSFLNGWVTG